MTRPTIGITRDSDGSDQAKDTAYPYYLQSVQKAGGEAKAIYFSEDIAGISAILDSVDGLLLSGGNDIDPALYGQHWHPMAKHLDPRRQRYELALLAEAERRRMPLLGICLGCQLINVFRGGTLIQFLPDAPRPCALEHRKINEVLLRHDVILEAESQIGQAIGMPKSYVNTYHKQAIDQIGRGLWAVAHAPDGVIEAIEDDSLPLFAGVQWHPERISDEPDQLAIFQLLVKRAAEYHAR